MNNNIQVPLPTMASTADVNNYNSSLGNVSSNWFSGGGSDGTGWGGQSGDFFGFGGSGNDISGDVSRGNLANQNQEASWWNWGDTMDANGNKQSGIGSTAIGLGNLGLQAYMGWKQLGMAEDQLSHNKETFAYNKSAQERAYRDNQDYNKRVAAALG